MCQVIATCRKPETADDLKSLKDQYDSRLSIVPLDVLNESTIATAAQQVKDSHNHIDLLINTTGILHQSDYPDLPERSISKLKVQQREEHNGIGCFVGKTRVIRT